MSDDRRQRSYGSRQDDKWARTHDDMMTGVRADGPKRSTGSIGLQEQFRLFGQAQRRDSRR
eukprot:11175249-Lingulodinium_polyedra.AAC.1